MRKIIALTALLAAVQFSCYAESPQPVYMLPDAQNIGSVYRFEYKPESLYEINCKAGYITDIALKPGEGVVHIAAGDTSQWMVDRSAVGNVTHIYIKPKVKEARTNMIINTQLHSYRLVLNSTDTYTPMVDWTFTDEEAAAAEKIERSEEIKKAFRSECSSSDEGVKLNFAYKLKNKENVDESIYPKTIFDDGIRTYIVIPKNNRYDLPVLYNVEHDGKLTLVNYRVKGSMMIADRCFKHARLSFGSDSSVDIVPQED